MDTQLLIKATIDTILMSIISVFCLCYCLPIGVLLNITSKKGIKPNRIINLILGIFVNIMRSIPRLLLIVILIPLTNIVFGKGSWSGNWYSMVIPLIFASFAFVARMVEQSLSEIDNGIIEASKSLGANNWQIV